MQTYQELHRYKAFHDTYTGVVEGSVTPIRHKNISSPALNPSQNALQTHGLMMVASRVTHSQKFRVNTTASSGTICCYMSD